MFSDRSKKILFRVRTTSLFLSFSEVSNDSKTINCTSVVTSKICFKSKISLKISFVHFCYLNRSLYTLNSNTISIIVLHASWSQIMSLAITIHPQIISMQLINFPISLGHRNEAAWTDTSC